jgi:hypothetical protein
MTGVYVPILPTKSGELSGLTDLDPQVRSSLTPLFMIHPISYDFEADRASKTADQHVAGLGKKIVCAARGVQRAFLDPILISDEPIADGASDPVQKVLNDAPELGMPLIPVVRPGQSDAYTAVVMRAHRDTGVGACLRLTPGQWPINAGRARAVENVLAAIGVDLTETDFVLDLGAEVNSELAPELASMALQTLPEPKSWRTITLAGGAFPEYLRDVPRSIAHRITRREWALYTQVRNEAADAGRRIPAFGDYAVAHPDPTTGDVDQRVMNISAAVRYTIDGAWLVAKGGLYKSTGGRSLGGSAAIPVAAIIASAPEFCGSDFSTGDYWIDQTPPDVRHREPRQPSRAFSRVLTTH